MQLFLKAPRPGLVKTRLAEKLGATQATEVYKTLVTAQLNRLPAGIPLDINFAPDDAEIEFREWLGEEFNYYPQPDGHLGERLEFAVGAAFRRGAERVICIGGDCPLLSAKQILQCIDSLNDGKDVVFGPTEDGGYYLIGMSALQSELFIDIPWSSKDTLKASLEKATALGLEIGLLETLYDIDTVSDLKRADDEGAING